MYTTKGKEGARGVKYTLLYIKGTLSVQSFNGEYLSIPSAHR